MKSPAFKPNDVFIHGAQIPCLTATGRNSSLPKLARRHIAESGEDSEFTVYLRAASRGGITDWQQSILQRLFEQEELPRIVEQGMKALEESVFGKFEGDADVERDGMLPYLYVTAIVIDDISKEIFFSLDTEKNFKPHEREIVIYQDGGDWHFDDAGYIDNYL